MNNERIITDEIKYKAIHVLDYFNFDRKHTIAHLLLSLDLLYSVKAPEEMMKTYQDVLYYVSKVWVDDGIQRRVI